MQPLIVTGRDPLLLLFETAFQEYAHGVIMLENNLDFNDSTKTCYNLSSIVI